MQVLLALFLCICLVFYIVAAATTYPFSDDYIDGINRAQNSWIAGRNFPNATIEELRRKNGVLGFHSDPNFKPTLKRHLLGRVSLPESFDAREQWPHCESIASVRDQGACGSCWAFATVEVMTDRICIHSSSSKKFTFSVEDVLSCCGDCGNCGGGYAMNSFYYYYQKGTVSGGDLNSNEGCQPYTSDAHDSGQTPACSTSCRSGYKTSYTNDKHFGLQPYIVDSTIEQMQYEIMTNGPLAVMFRVYDDFFSYQSGVYQHTTGDYNSYHSVKIIGWGTENNTPYWLVANSWGYGFGQLNGFFKMLRGQNECGIEDYPYTVLPNL